MAQLDGQGFEGDIFKNAVPVLQQTKTSHTMIYEQQEQVLITLTFPDFMQDSDCLCVKVKEINPSRQKQ